MGDLFWGIFLGWGHGGGVYLRVREPPVISHEVRPFGRRTSLLRGLTNQVYQPLTNGVALN